MEDKKKLHNKPSTINLLYFAKKSKCQISKQMPNPLDIYKYNQSNLKKLMFILKTNSLNFIFFQIKVQKKCTCQTLDTKDPLLTYTQNKFDLLNAIF